MKRVLKKNEKIQLTLLVLSVALFVIGIMFLLTAMDAVRVFPAVAGLSHVLVKYIFVLLVMSTSIMLFSNVAITLENKKLRNGLTIGITTISTVLTVPLIYVFIAIFPAQSSIIGPVGKVMMLDKIVADFNAIFPNEGALYFIYALLFILSLIFIAVPLLTGGLAIKEKTLKIGKKENGKFGVSIAVLPVVARLAANSDCSEEKCECCCGNHNIDQIAQAVAADTTEEN